MTLEDFLKYLTGTVLAHTYMGEDVEGDIRDKHALNVLTSINLGLVDIYKEFLLNEKEAIIQLDPSVTRYQLHTDFAQSNTESSEPIKYIQDSVVNPFVNDVMQIEVVLNEEGAEFPLNDEDDSLSVYTIGHNVVQMSYPDLENVMHVIYRAGPTKIALDLDLNDTPDVNIEIADFFIEPLTFFVANKIFNSKDQNNLQEGPNWFLKYQNSITQIKLAGLVHKPNKSGEKFSERGFA